MTKNRCVALECPDFSECPHGSPHEAVADCSARCPAFPLALAARCYEYPSLRYALARISFAAAFLERENQERERP